MATKLGKPMGNKESSNQVENDSVAAVLESSEIQERTMSGMAGVCC